MANRIAFLGPVGTYTEEAALQHDLQADFQPFPTIAAVGLYYVHRAAYTSGD